MTITIEDASNIAHVTIDIDFNGTSEPSTKVTTTPYVVPTYGTTKIDDVFAPSDVDAPMKFEDGEEFKRPPKVAEGMTDDLEI